MTPDDEKAKQNAPMIKDVHEQRQNIQTIIDHFKENYTNREAALVITKLQEAKMWAGQVLGVLGSTLPAEYRDDGRK